MNKFAVSLNNAQSRYEVYEIATGKTIETFSFRPDSEKDRTRAAGLANATRSDFNREEIPPSRRS
jgi:hypothetical protein